MSQSVGITLKVTMRPEAFRRYMQAEAQSIARLLTDLRETSEEDDFYMLKYIKRSETFYSFIYYGHGDREWLEKSPFYPVLMNLGNYLEADNTGYLLGTMDAASPWKKEHAVFNYHIQGNTPWKDGMSDEQFKQVQKDCALFFNQVDKGSFYDQLEENNHLLDKAIRTHYIKQKEEHRRRRVWENLHTATPGKPLLLFGNWHYDGQYLLSWTGNKYPQFNIRKLRETPYGVTDGTYLLAITYDKVLHTSFDLVLKTDPAQFKRLAKGDSTTYFKSKETVYNAHLEPLPEADPVTFKVLAECVAADRNYLYLGHLPGKRIPVKELGEPYRYDLPVNYSTEEILFIGSKKIYIGWHPVEGVEAATCQLLPPADLPEKVSALIPPYTWNLRTKAIRHWRCRDRNGEFYLLIHVHDMESYPQYVRDIPGLPLGQPIVVRI